MQHRKSYEISIFVIGCILINCIGKWLAGALQLPLWMDSFGTVLAAYVLGPICGAFIGAAVKYYIRIAFIAFTCLCINKCCTWNSGRHLCKKGIF